MPKVLVAGASGYLGRFVTQAFKQSGFWVRALAHKPQKLEQAGPFLEPAVKDQIDAVFVGEVTQPDTLPGVCDGIDIVFSSIGITRQRDKVSFMQVDYQGNKNLLTQAKQAGVKKFVFVSVFKADMIDNLAAARELFVAAASGDDKDISVGGPQSYTHQDIAELAFAVLGKTPKITKIPIWIINLALKFIRPFSSHYYTIGSFFATVMQNDFEAPKAGRRLLKDYYEALAP